MEPNTFVVSPVTNISMRLNLHKRMPSQMLRELF